MAGRTQHVPDPALFLLIKPSLCGKRGAASRGPLFYFSTAAIELSDLPSDIDSKPGWHLRSAIDCCIAQAAIDHDVLLVHRDRDIETIAENRPLRQARMDW